MKDKGKLIVISSVSGAGKTTLVRYLLQENPDLVYSISATSRKPRKGEVNGIDYFFYTKEEFEKKIDKGDFIEWAIVHENYYGTPREFISKNLSNGKNMVLILDVYGKYNLNSIHPDSVGILINPPSMDVLEERLIKRGDDKDTIGLRINNAKKEIEFSKKEGLYDYFITNDDLDKAKSELLDIVESILE